MAERAKDAIEKMHKAGKKGEACIRGGKGKFPGGEKSALKEGGKKEKESS